MSKISARNNVRNSLGNEAKKPEVSAELYTGTFEPDGRGGGFLRSASQNYARRRNDPAVTAHLCRSLGLRGGETLVVRVGGASGRETTAVSRREDVVTVDDLDPPERAERKPFEDLTAVNPSRKVCFEMPGGPLSMRIVDLMTPIGFGQRGLIVAAPRTGKTILLQQMAAGIAANHAELYMMVLLIDERPEEVTEMRRTVHGEVVASSNDRDVASHVRIARLMIEKAKRMVETGKDVLILLDSLTRLGRAFNAAIQGSRRIMSGGLDIRALTEPKAIFGAARAAEEGGSLTIIASCLIETGSRMDDVIFNEFKGTGNMEIVLTRSLANRRIWPAMDLQASGTRREELLLSSEALNVAHRLRRIASEARPEEAMPAILQILQRTDSNADLIAQAGSAAR